MLTEFWYVQFKSGEIMYFETELAMYKYLYKTTRLRIVKSYGKDYSEE